MKKILSLLLVICVLFTFALFAAGSGSDDKKSGDQGAASADGTQPQETEAENTELGKYTVVIDSCRLAKDYEGKPIIIVKYIFTNVSDENPAAFYLCFDDAAFQNGVGLNECYVTADSANYEADNQMKEIKMGASLEVEVAYELNDETTDVEIEVSELFSWDDTVLTKTFTIAE